MNIKKAFCVETQSVLNIYQAREAFFAQNYKKDLNFLCADHLCRKLKRPVIIGVNYRKLVQKGDFFSNRLHFREHHKYPHYECCPEYELTIAKEIVEKENAQKQNCKRKKTSDVIDVFAPFQDGSNTHKADNEDKKAKT